MLADRGIWILLTIEWWAMYIWWGWRLCPSAVVIAPVYQGSGQVMSRLLDRRVASEDTDSPHKKPQRLHGAVH